MLESSGASFFDPLHQAAGGGYPGESIDALWSLVWRGLITNDSLHALRAYTARPETRADAAAACRPAWCFARGARRRRRRRGGGRCCRCAAAANARGAPTATEASHALAMQLLNRYGVLMRESVAAENVAGGFSAVYDVLKALEESGRIRRGYFVAGLGATQFALPAAMDLLRQMRTAADPEKPEFVQLAAADPANPYGSVLPWPELPVAEEDSEVGAAGADAGRVCRGDSVEREAGGVAAAQQSEPAGVSPGGGAGAVAGGRGAGAVPVDARTGDGCTWGAARAYWSRPSTGSRWRRIRWRGS